MSTLVGDRLPAAMVEQFNGEELSSKIGPAYLFVTADDDGAPRPCMLSVGEILVPDDRHVRLALWEKSHTCANLSAGRPSLFCYVAAGVVLYVRGVARAIGTLESLHLECFEIKVSTVESDEHPGMPATETIRFAVTGAPPDEIVREWQHRLGELGRL